jgi:hypothetical protein
MRELRRNRIVKIKVEYEAEPTAQRLSEGIKGVMT